jgi:uncharacterized protein GlcG (DUF336 family)
MPRLKIVKYAPAMFDRIFEQVSELHPDYPLRFRGFVDAYYASSKFCQLNVALDEHGAVAGLQGVEWMPFEDQGKQLKLGFGSNFHAFRPGAGAYLLMSSLRSCNAGLIFGGSPDMNNMITKAGWRYFTGIKNMLVNRRISPDPKDGALKGLVKTFVKHAPFRQALTSLADRLPRCVRGVTAAEVASITDDLLDFKSAFGFRFAPDRAYLAWRYGPEVPYLRHRTFRVARNGRHVGYAVLLAKDEQVVVAHADGSEPVALAAGIVKAISAIAQGTRDFREVVLTSAHPAMQQMFENVGFVNKPKWDRPFALGGLKGGFDVVTPVSQWMVNFGWGDNALRPPFVEKPAAEPLARAA